MEEVTNVLKQCQKYDENKISDKYNLLINMINDIGETLSDKYDILNDKLINISSKNIENAKLSIDNIKKIVSVTESDNSETLNLILKNLKDIKDEKGESYSKRNVEEILEMILQHLRDLQRSQLQWTHNYGENNIKMDLKFEKITESVTKLSELSELSELIRSFSINNTITDHISKYEFKNEMNMYIEDINDQFSKQLHVIKGINNRLISEIESINTKYEDMNTKVDELFTKINNEIIKKKKKTFLNGGGV